MVWIKDTEQRKEWPYCLLWFISKSFFGLFWRSICTVVFVCLVRRGTGLCQQKDKVEMLLFMSIGSPVYQPPDWHNEMVEERSGRRMWKRQGEQNGRLEEVVCLEHSGLNAIWWRWSEVLKIDNVLDMSQQRFDHTVPNRRGFVWDKSLRKRNKRAWGDGH